MKNGQNEVCTVHFYVQIFSYFFNFYLMKYFICLPFIIWLHCVNENDVYNSRYSMVSVHPKWRENNYERSPASLIQLDVYVQCTYTQTKCIWSINPYEAWNRKSSLIIWLLNSCNTKRHFWRSVPLSFETVQCAIENQQNKTKESFWETGEIDTQINSYKLGLFIAIHK